MYVYITNRQWYHIRCFRATYSLIEEDTCSILNTWYQNDSPIHTHLCTTSSFRKWGGIQRGRERGRGRQRFLFQSARKRKTSTTWIEGWLWESEEEKFLAREVRERRRREEKAPPPCFERESARGEISGKESEWEDRKTPLRMLSFPLFFSFSIILPTLTYTLHFSCLLFCGAREKFVWLERETGG